MVERAASISWELTAQSMPLPAALASWLCISWPGVLVSYWVSQISSVSGVGPTPASSPNASGSLNSADPISPKGTVSPGASILAPVALPLVTIRQFLLHVF